MDAKNKIILEQPEEECLDVSISKSPACSLYVTLVNGIEATKANLKDLEAVENTLKQEAVPNLEALRKLAENKKIMQLCIGDSTKFLHALGEILKELDEKPKSKIILPRQKFT